MTKKALLIMTMLLIPVGRVIAKGQTESQAQGSTVQENGQSGTASATGVQVKNQNMIKTQNEGEDSQLTVQNAESQKTEKSKEESETEVMQSMDKVSDQVKLLIETTGAKGGIGDKVRDIAQSQVKNQDEIKSDVEKLNARGSLVKILLGADKKTVQSLEMKMEQNRLMIQQLEELKLETNNTSDLQQLQETIDLMIYQNTSLQDKVERESKGNGVFGWLVALFN